MEEPLLSSIIGCYDPQQKECKRDFTKTGGGDSEGVRNPIVLDSHHSLVWVQIIQMSSNTVVHARGIQSVGNNTCHLISD